MKLISQNPATEEIVAEFEAYDKLRIDSILDAALEGFGFWRQQPIDARARLLFNVADRLERNAEQYAKLITEEMGKPINESVAEVKKCAWVCRYYAENAAEMLAPREVQTDARRSYVRFDPLGVLLAIMPWNFPFWQVFRAAAPALAAGNVVVLKHASNVPRCALAIEELFKESGAPDGVFSALLISGAEAEQLISDPRIAAVTLTGSEEAGQRVARVAGAALKKCVLELGGSDPFIVLEDAKVEEVARAAATARTINSGQSCIAAKRFIVHKDVYRKFVDTLKAELEALPMGDPLDPQTRIGPLARDDLRRSLHKLVQDSVEQGAQLVLGGSIPKMKGFFYPPTLLIDVTPEMPVATEETFGPVAVVLPAEDEQDALRIANSSRFGLGASVWTANPERGEQLAAKIEAGCVFVNGIVKSDPRLPFGGVKASGFGRELSIEGIREFTNIKTVWIG